MHYLHSDELRLVRDAAAKFASGEVDPIATRIDLEESTPPSLVRRVAELGFFGLCIPEEYGGSGAGLTAACIVLEEIAKASPSFAGLLSVQMVLCPSIVLQLGSSAQKHRLLPRIATGERLLAYSQTEPAGALNYTAHQTRLQRENGVWRLNGAKLFCTQGTAGTYLVMCRTERDGQAGYGCVIVEREASGFAVGPYEDKMGWRGTNTGGISFTDVLVREQDVLGDLLTAGVDFLPAFYSSFISHSATSLGAAEGLFDKTVNYVGGRTMYGAPMSQLSPLNTSLGDAYGKIQAARALLYTATHESDQGGPNIQMLSRACKTFICEASFQCCHALLQMWGGTGIMNATGVNRYFRDARTNLVAEAPTEYHLKRIAQGLFE